MPEEIKKTLGELAKRVGGNVQGDKTIQITGITNATHPHPGHITYATDAKTAEKLGHSEIAALILPPNLLEAAKPCIIAENPKLAWGMILEIFFPARSFKPEISNRAFIHSTAVIGKGVRIEDGAYIGEQVKIGERTVVRANSFIDDFVSIGNACVIHPNVTIYDHTVVGNRVTIHAGSVIGTDGFGYVFNGKEQFKIRQVGNVVLEDDVELGGNVSIDRATVGSTVIRAGSKIDNLVQIAHNVSFGPHSVASAQTGISGSTAIGAYVTLAGQVGVGDHCEIGNGAILGAQAGIPTGKKIPERAIFIGSPARPAEDMKKQVAAQLRMRETIETLRDLKKRVAELEKQLAASFPSAPK
ncbi:MAG: UDP-3-O-(3-hydroxymyristoyl)glucosamine N-acyltransferase [Candidatus Omnitrophica bacterium]|nr:UDP-3-O-(3-hydroxymyristoyl)glucosamine N-acyltransferase [Candidatus Omnitrophota bacterium]